MIACPACHDTQEPVVIPGVTRWADVFACKNCGTLRIRVNEAKQIAKDEKGKGGDS